MQYGQASPAWTKDTITVASQSGTTKEAVFPLPWTLPALLFWLAMVLATAWVALNRLDLDDPLQNDVYEELTPLLKRIDKSNKEKEQNENRGMSWLRILPHQG